MGTYSRRLSAELRGFRTVFSLGGDDGRWRRLTLAVAGSIAAHEILLGLVALFGVFQAPQTPADQVVAERITIVIHRPVPPTPPPIVPTPAPTPHVSPTPRIALTTKKLLQARPRAAATPAQHRGGAAAPKMPTVAEQRLRVHPLPQPAWQHVALSGSHSLQNGRAMGQANGGAGTGAGPGNGNGGDNGIDSGTGGNGTEVGMDTPLSPCGAVYFDQIPPSTHNPDGSVYEKVRMRVYMRDGHEASDVLHWYFYYPTIAADPLARKDDGDRMPLQFPPRGYDLEGSQNPAIVLAIKHTRPNGTTDLPDCPG